MIKWKVSIEMFGESSEADKYPRGEKIYEQTVTQIDVLSVIKAVNSVSPHLGFYDEATGRVETLFNKQTP